MAVTDHIPYRDADDLARTEDKGFYPVHLPISHWQLRYYISNPEPNILYYASGSDVYCLNTASKKRKHIATVPFISRCTASGYGWVCVGGEHEGQFAAIRLEGSVESRTLDVDSALPINSWHSSRRGATVNVDKIGKDYLNSISIHRIKDEEAHLDDIVAIVTNNDKTVRVYSLPQGIETTRLELPFAMNHATLSPDGQIIVAVGDVSRAYFFARELKDSPPQIPKPHNRLTAASLDWTEMCRVELHVSGPEKTNGYFTTAWSPSGQLVAVGSEAGYITVFDIDILTNPDFDDQDAVVAVTPTSRADIPPHAGAVRSMMFSPDPWDLLIWAEDAGRVCIGDLRTGLRSKQIINIEPREENVRHIEVQELPNEDIAEAGRSIDELETDFLQRYREGTERPNYVAEYIGARRRHDLARARNQVSSPDGTQTAEDNSGLSYAQWRQQHQESTQTQRTSPPTEGPPAFEDDPRGLTAREQQILESVRTTRQREEARANGQAPRTVNYTTPDLFTGSNSRSSRSATPNNGPASSSASARHISDILSSVQDTLPELSRTSATVERPGSSHGPNPRHDLALPPLHLLNDNSWVVSRTSSGVPRISDLSRLPRRRASVILALPNVNASSPRSEFSSLSPEDENERDHAEEREGDDDNPWRTIEDHMDAGRGLARGPLFESTSSATDVTSARPSEAEFLNTLAHGPERARNLNRERQRWRSIRSETSSTTAVPASGANATRIAGFAEGYEALIQRSERRGLLSTGVITAERMRRRGLSGVDSARRDSNGVRTAGLAMSADGRMLWAACEEGIFEMEINVKGRMFWGAIEPL
ncbi:Hypothetical protein R9X50_00272400 [Acrodontium crateriforme]|uniref:DUF2415 domain-containing protein n=1 Tax=Acrodontium crateriforme TaxID=150365 RepID=A0AAQ3M1S1_9PEZI|nr:Hypothetical protein R9X50_00272400 [Acrodontium crateriforme]